MKNKNMIITVISIMLLIAVVVSVVIGSSKGGTKNVATNETTSEMTSETTKEQEPFFATVLEINEDSVLVEPLEVEGNTIGVDKITFNTELLAKINIEVGSIVKITYIGGIMKSYPAQINVTKWALVRELRHLNYNGVWLDKATTPKEKDDVFADVRITRIFANCFFAESQCEDRTEIKINGELPEEYGLGSRVTCTYENAYYDEEKNQMEVDMLTVEEIDWDLGSMISQDAVAYKPVIYLYPEKTMDVSVKLELDGEFTCVYPSYNDGWDVTAYPDGTLTDDKGQTYNYLYWEGNLNAEYDFSKGFCVKGEDTAKFLEEALEKLGLTRREANEFIVYWLPLMEQNPYNIISFQTDVYTDAAKLNVNPAPDTMIRVFMTWESSDEFVELPEQEFSAPERNGFTVVEWGGTEIKTH